MQCACAVVCTRKSLQRRLTIVSVWCNFTFHLSKMWGYPVMSNTFFIWCFMQIVNLHCSLWRRSFSYGPLKSAFRLWKSSSFMSILVKFAALTSPKNASDVHWHCLRTCSQPSCAEDVCSTLDIQWVYVLPCPAFIHGNSQIFNADFAWWSFSHLHHWHSWNPRDSNPF